MSLSFSKFLYAPAFPIEAVDGCIVLGDHPVCADYALITILVAEKVGDDIFAVAVADILA